MLRLSTTSQRMLTWALFATMAVGVSVIVAAALGWGGLEADHGAALTIVALSKWMVLLLGGVAGTACALRLTRRSWRLMAAGFWFFAAGQSVLVYFQLVRHQPIPFPSPADIFFLAGVLLLAAALAAFLLELSRSGFPIELGGRLPWISALVVGAGALVSWTMLRPLLPVEVFEVKTVLSLLYPITDLLLLVPVVALQQVTLQFRGGEVWRVWTTILIGFGLFLLGDLSFALYLEDPSRWLAAIVDGCYLLGYGLISRAFVLQLGILD